MSGPDDGPDDVAPGCAYCPVCSATYPVAPLTDAACPNADQDDHTNSGNRPTGQGPGRRAAWPRRSHRRSGRGGGRR